MDNNFTREDLEQADRIILGIHKQAYFGRLAQHGYVPRGETRPAIEKEAAALLNLGFDLAQMQPTTGEANLGNGPFAMAKQALDNHLQSSAPGFEAFGKQAAPGFDDVPAGDLSVAIDNLPPALIDAAYKVAVQLARDPAVYRAATIKRAFMEAMAAKTQGAGATAAA